MTIILLFLFFSACFILSDLIPIYRAKQWKVFWIYSIIIALVFLATLLTAMDIRIPSVPIKKIIHSISK